VKELLLYCLRSEAGLREVQQQPAASGDRALVVPVDLAEPSSIDHVKGVIEDDLGTRSILVNAAGVFGPIDSIKDNDPAAWIETVVVSTVASYLTCRAFVGGSIDRGSGRMVKVTSWKAGGSCVR
jgi:NAD(P)-dependent dehydrogenase (short-subunit alcohol dehydrogenase family)